MFCLRAFSASDGKVLLLPVETGESEISFQPYLLKFKPAMQIKHFGAWWQLLMIT